MHCSPFPSRVRIPDSRRLGYLRHRPIGFLLLTVCVCFGQVHQAVAIGQPRYIESVPVPGSFPIVQQSNTASLYVDPTDWPGVVRAVNDLQADVVRVTGCSPTIVHDATRTGTNTILIGTIGKSPIIDQLIQNGKIDVSSIRGKWESFLIAVVPAPLPGVNQSLVIAGSDKRGTIYGIYDLSEQIGVSPWYWWADVPARHQNALFVKPGVCLQGPPAVKYRGIFLNDEAPDLTGWVKEKFGDYNHGFYTNVFELLLRLKANYLWPAMWNNCFNEDDPLNPKLADEYGIVMGTSHVEPMMRADKEWNRAGYNASQWNYDKFPKELDKFWQTGIERNQPYENIITIAMRGKIDTPMSETANIALLEKIVAAQRRIIADVMHTNVETVSQLWALYKEVQEYYEKGMRVPDDVLLLWCDDNWGNVRRLPAPEERNRGGGAGVYYHFDYVGGPRNYKWVNTVPITKVQEQMNLAYHYGADRLWVVNVGHLHHVTFPMEFFLNLAWDPDKWPPEKLKEYSRLWAEREFGPRFATEIGSLVAAYTKFNARRKPELLDSTTFSVVNYMEADLAVSAWRGLSIQADDIYHRLPKASRDAFFELVVFPIKACAGLNELYVVVAKNRLYAAQGRAGANELAARARTWFKTDADLANYYNHELAGGKWNHMMDQTHIGYTGWQQPPKNVMPEVFELSLPTNAIMGIALEGSTNSWPNPDHEAALPPFHVYNPLPSYIDVFNRGSAPFEYSVTTDAPWIQMNPVQGTVQKEERVWVGVDWNMAPVGTTNAFIRVTGNGTNTFTVAVKIFNPSEPTRDSARGFVEANGYVSIEAEHYTRKIDAGAVRWEKLPDYGRTLSAMTIFPVTAGSVTPPAGSPCLEYQMYLFTTGKVEVASIIAPTLNFLPDRGLRFAVSFDDEAPGILTAVPKGFSMYGGNRDQERNWEESVKDNSRQIKSTHEIRQPGLHTLKIWMVDPALVLQKIVINTGGLRPSYLGPPESFHRPVASSGGGN